MPVIRRSTEQDTETIHRFTTLLQEHLYKSNPDTWHRNPETEGYHQQVTREATDPEVYTLIAEVEGEPVAYISSRVMDRGEPGPQRVGVIMNAYTVPEHRGKGIATTLMQKIVEYFKAENVEQVTLRYVVGNREAEHYWTKLGFKPVITVANTTLTDLDKKLNTS